MGSVQERRKRLKWLGAGLIMAAQAPTMLAVAQTPAGQGTAQMSQDLPEKIRQSGVLRVAVYRDFAPYHQAGKGIDVEVAARVAERLGLKLSLMPFDEDENLNDDLRNMVWKGHYLGYGPADIMIHVPVDRHLMEANPQVLIFGPYHRETLRLAWNTTRIPSYDDLGSLAGQRIGVDGTSMAAQMLVTTRGGAHRDHVAVFRNTYEALEALKRQEVAAVIGHASELENGLRGVTGVKLEDSPFDGPARRGWAVGFAVRKDQQALARLVQEAVTGMLASGEMMAIFGRHGVALKAA